MEGGISRARLAILAAQEITVLTGAGISAESGVPTFRGEGGLWRQYRAIDLATPQAFARDPALVWEFYNWRRSLIAKVSPNPAHEALAELESRTPHFTLVTQNIDGLHQRAGSRNILELHGNIWKVRCTACGEVFEEYRPDLGTDPRCVSCGGLLRPHVIWFGESLEPRVLSRAVKAARSCQVMLVVGTSAVVQPAASLSLDAKRHGAFVVEVNLERTPQTPFVDCSLLGKAGEILPRLLSPKS